MCLISKELLYDVHECFTLFIVKRIGKTVCVVLVPGAVCVVQHPFSVMTSYCVFSLCITVKLPLNVKPSSQLNKTVILIFKAVLYLCRNSLSLPQSKKMAQETRKEVSKQRRVFYARNHKHLSCSILEIK